MQSIRTYVLLALCLCASALWCQDNAYEGERREIIAPKSLTPPVIANSGQFDEAVRFIIPGPHGTVIFMKRQVVVALERTDDANATPGKDYLRLLPDEVREAALTRRIPSLSSPAEVIRIVFVKGDPEAAIEGVDKQPTPANHLVGNDSSKWATGIPVFKGVAYRSVWPGVDLIFKVNGGKITCTPMGDDLDRVEFERTVNQNLGSDEVGETLSGALAGRWTFRKGTRGMLDRQGVFVTGPVYVPTSKMPVDKPSDYTADCFVLSADLSSGRPRWITILGGGLQDSPNGVAVDRHGYLYLTGFTRSADFPMAVGDWGQYFSAKLNPSGSSLARSTYLTSGGGGLGLEPFAARSKSPEKLLAITIDDGRDEAQIKPFLDLGIPVTFAVMPWVDPTCIRRIKARDCAAFLHAPMEALGSVNRNSEEVTIGQTSAQVNELLAGWLALTPGVVGISNHRGSAATSDPETMRRVAAFAKKHGLFLYDSNTAPVSIAVNIGRGMGVPCLQQDFFLDDREPSLVRARLLAMADLADRTGYATCICHVGRPVVPETIRALIPELQARGFRFVTVPELYEALTKR